MKTLKKITSVVVALSMVMALITVTPTKTEAAVKIIVGKKLTMNYGKTDQIMVKGTGVKATSSNKKIAKVTKVKKAGKNTIITVKGVKSGKATIKVKKGSSSKKVKVTVNPAKVTIVDAARTSLADATCNSIKVTWKKAKGATGYYVYYSTNATSGFKSVKIKGGSKTSTIVSGLTNGAKYYFKVKAYGNNSTKSSSYSSVKAEKTYKLTWSDEFNYTDTNKLSTNWTYEEGHGEKYGNPGWGNNELQYYTTGDNVKLNGTNLVIIPKYTTNNVAEKYTSTIMVSRGKKSFKYGRIEFRAKLPKGQGTWAACWMLGSSNKWPLCGEIDVLETTKDITKTTIPQSIHCNRFNGMPTSTGNKFKHTTVSTATSAYHTYGIEWDEQVIKFYIDGKYTWTYDPDVYSAIADGNSNVDIWPYNQPFYLILNCAIGGTLGGSVGSQYWTSVGNNTYEDYMYVDYVRVYQ